MKKNLDPSNLILIVGNDWQRKIHYLKRNLYGVVSHLIFLTDHILFKSNQQQVY